jgi:8-oxo-dGTP diphosphatase
VPDADDDLAPPAQTYNEWLKGYDPDRWADDRQTLAADVVVLTILGSALSLVLRRRTEWPEYGSWVLPGAFVRQNEPFDDTARRAIDEAGISGSRPLIRLNFFDSPDRDPHRQVGSLAYLSLCGPNEAAAAVRAPHRVLGTIVGDEVHINGTPVQLGFAHHDIVSYACEEVRRRLQADPLWIVPALSDDVTFTVAGLNAARQTLGAGMTDDALRRKVAADNRVRQIGWVDAGTGKASRLYRVFP